MAFRAVFVLSALAAVACGARLQACPSTSIKITTQEDAAGTPIYIKYDMPKPDTCVAIGHGMVKAAEICGPGKFKASRMSCERHEYKALIIEQSDKHFTASTCKTYDLTGTVIDGYMGSFSFSCSTTSR